MLVPTSAAPSHVQRSGAARSRHAMATAANTVGCTEAVIARILQSLGCESLLVLLKSSFTLQLAA